MCSLLRVPDFMGNLFGAPDQEKRPPNTVQGKILEGGLLFPIIAVTETSFYKQVKQLHRGKRRGVQTHKQMEEELGRHPLHTAAGRTG